MTLASIALPNWISYNITSIKGHSITRNIGLHKTCSSGIDPFSDSPTCRPFPIEREDCAGDERGFCSIWRTTGFLMSLAIVVELATLVGFLVIMAGGKMKRVTGWKILSCLLVSIATLLLMSMGTVVRISRFRCLVLHLACSTENTNDCDRLTSLTTTTSFRCRGGVWTSRGL